MLSVEKPKLAPGASPDIKKLHALLCQVQVDLIQIKSFSKNKEMRSRAVRDFGYAFPELLKYHARCLQEHQIKHGNVCFTSAEEPQYSSQEIIRLVFKTVFHMHE